MSEAIVSVAEFQRMLTKIDGPDFNIKDLNELREMWKKDCKYWLKDPFWGAVLGKFFDLAEIGLIKKNMGGE